VPTDLLAIRLAWEEALLAAHGDAVAARWGAVRIPEQVGHLFRNEVGR
jgi:hypothetical protein